MPSLGPLDLAWGLRQSAVRSTLSLSQPARQLLVLTAQSMGLATYADSD